MMNTAANLQTTQAEVIKPPTSLPEAFQNTTIFLAGSIEQGLARDWQSELFEALKDKPVTLLNPRRDSWDSSWKQDIDEPQFRSQVLWELEGQERADLILMFFQPETKSPVTLLELGLFAQSGKLVVCCPPGYWRKGNVDVVCRRYNIKQVETLDELIKVATDALA